MENLDAPFPPNQRWGNGAFLPFARLHPWFGWGWGMGFAVPIYFVQDCRSEIDRFHCHATKKINCKPSGAHQNWNRPVEEDKKMKCYKRLIYKQFILASGLCEPQFLSYLPKRFTRLCTVLVHQYGRRKSTKTSRVHFLYKRSFFSFENFLILKMVRLLQIKRRDLFSTRKKLGSLNCRIFKMKHATGVETCTKIYFLFIFNLV